MDTTDFRIVPAIVTTLHHHSPPPPTSAEPEMRAHVYTTSSPVLLRVERSRRRQLSPPAPAPVPVPGPDDDGRHSVNPFTPPGRKILQLNNERDDDDDSTTAIATNVSLRDLQTSRFREEFRTDGFIAMGAFGQVYRCTNLMDGIAYAVKKTRETTRRRRGQENAMRKEVYAHSACGRHPHVVSYFTAWHEDDGHVYIQTELCDGGTLENAVHGSDRVFCDRAIRRLLRHVCKGLAHIHSKTMAHLDVKAANILISRGARLLDDDDDDDDETVDRDVVYKIGDFGHAVYVEDARTVEEGDCRYLPRELLRDDYSQLPKADVFSTALAAYEAATKRRLPKNGLEWHALRDGQFALPRPPPVYSAVLERLLKRMVDSNPANRPSASTVVGLLRRRNEIESWKFSSSSNTCRRHSPSRYNHFVKTRSPRPKRRHRIYENST